MSNSLDRTSPNKLLSPFGYFTAFYLYQAVATPLLQLLFIDQLDSSVYRFTSFKVTLLLSFIYYISVFLGVTASPKFGQTAFNKLIYLLSLKNKNIRSQNMRSCSLLFFLLFIFSFLFLAKVSGAGTLWILDSRKAYQLYRNGVGVFYAVTATLLTLSYTSSLFAFSRLTANLMIRFGLKTLFYMFAAYFLGSKALILGIAVIGVVYFNYNIKRVRSVWIFSVAILLVLSTSLLQLSQGTAQNLLDTLFYANYFSTTDKFISLFDENFNFLFGKVFFSNFWSYVPRIIYPDKPYEYGILLVHKVLFPGAAAQSFTPGILPWAGAFLDLSLPGVILGGLAHGLLLGWVHNYYLKSRHSVVDFMVLVKVGGFPALFMYFPTPMFVFLILPVLSITVVITTNIVLSSRLRA